MSYKFIALYSVRFISESAYSKLIKCVVACVKLVYELRNTIETSYKFNWITFILSYYTLIFSYVYMQFCCHDNKQFIIIYIIRIKVVRMYYRLIYNSCIIKAL